MKPIHHIIYSSCLLMGAITLGSCEEDENLQLITYPEEVITLSVAGTEAEKEITKPVTYNEQSRLIGIDSVYKFKIALNTPAPKDVEVQLGSLLSNIPTSAVALPTSFNIPAGKTDGEVEVRFKDFSFLEENKGADTYSIALFPQKVEEKQSATASDTVKLKIGRA